jgi:GNAT superfamily N-acetyltransferase
LAVLHGSPRVLMLRSFGVSWTTGPVRDRRELEQIHELQRQNLAPALAAEEARAQGFVTVEHTLDTLERMHALAPSIVTRDGDRVVGYALAMAVEARRYVPILESMFQLLESLSWRGRPLSALPFYVMGQVCVAKAYRGRGVFDALYQGHKAEYAERFELCVTEIATRNTRSLRAHERVGFVPIHQYRDAVDEWLLVGWDW